MTVVDSGASDSAVRVQTWLLAQLKVADITPRPVRRFVEVCGDEGAQAAIARVLIWPLSRQLPGHRDALTQVWSLETIYPGSDPCPQPDRPASYGQCGVTSAWLIQQMSWLRRLRAEYCVGHIDFDRGRQRSEVHCWVEIGSSNSAKRWVIDLTFDQFGHRRSKPVVFARHEHLVKQLIEYKAQARIRPRKVREDDVWGRYELLRAATDELWKSRKAKPGKLTPL